MKCRAILRTNAAGRAGLRCASEAKFGEWCAVHDPRKVLPNLRRKRAKTLWQLELIDAQMAAYDDLPTLENPS